MAKRPTIYLISEDGGAAKTNSRNTVTTLKTLGYRECAQEEYAKRVRVLREEDARAVREERSP
jgi:hypothetical protein